MQVSNAILFTVIEVLIVLFIAVIALIIYARSLKGVVKTLQEKLLGLVADLKKSKAEFQELKAEVDPANAYQKQIGDQLLKTREYHLGLGADRDIALDLSTDAPLERQVAAFRHAMLVAEKEALLASSTNTPNWQVLQGKLSQLMQFYQHEPEADTSGLEGLQQELESSQRRVANLEKFKSLFFDMEDQWNQAKQQADEYYMQLSTMDSNDSSFNETLNRYHNVYDNIGNMIEAGASGQASAKHSARHSTHNRAEQSTVAQEELSRLRSVAANQHRIIAELERQLKNANTLEEKDAAISELQSQLQTQVRFVQEAETCVQLLEEELNTALERIHELEQSGAGDTASSEETEELRSMVSQFTDESKEMLQRIARLEQENQQLSQQVMVAGSSGDSSAELQQAIRQLKQVKAQYTELEERYLELKMR